MRLSTSYLINRIGFKWLVFVITSLVSLNVIAATDVELYSEQIVVRGNATQQEQADAIKEGFADVLVKVTGQKDVLTLMTIEDELEKGGQYLASFRFEASDVFFTNVLGEQVPTKTMVLDFDEKSVNTLLVKNQQPIWGARRPEVLIWVADRLQGRDHILSDSESTDVSRLLNEHTDKRGLPYLLPLMDLEDTLALSFSDVYGLFSRDIELASERYQSEAILAGRLTGSQSNAKGDWLILFKGERLRFSSTEGSLDDVIEQGIDAISKRLSAQYAFVSDPSLIGNLQIKIIDVQSLQTFSEVERYLKSINLITNATVHEFTEDDITFDIEISGDQIQLRDLLALDNHLNPIEETTLEAQLDNVLVYSWHR